MEQRSYRPKISFTVDEDLLRRYTDLDWGLRGKLMLEVTRQLFQAIDRGGISVAYAILSGQLGLFGRKE